MAGVILIILVVVLIIASTIYLRWFVKSELQSLREAVATSHIHVLKAINAVKPTTTTKSLPPENNNATVHAPTDEEIIAQEKKDGLR